MANDDDIKSSIVHGQPPNRGWFPKGKSGNPRGRPRKQKSVSAGDSSVRDAFLEAAGSLMKLTENGKKVTLTQRESVERSQFVAALKGSSHAQRNYFARDAKFLRERMEEIEKNHQWWQRYAHSYDMVAKGHAERGEQLPDYFPHPDELNFPKGRFVTGWFGGEPMQAAISRAHFIRVRDVFLLQAEKDRRYYGSEHELDHISGKIGLFINAFLPKAVQLDEVALLVRLGNH